MTVKQVKPDIPKIAGYFLYYCDGCIVQWLQQKDEPAIKCPYCNTHLAKLRYSYESVEKTGES